MVSSKVVGFSSSTSVGELEAEVETLKKADKDLKDGIIQMGKE